MRNSIVLLIDMQTWIEVTFSGLESKNYASRCLSNNEINQRSGQDQCAAESFEKQIRAEFSPNPGGFKSNFSCNNSPNVMKFFTNVQMYLHSSNGRGYTSKFYKFHNGQNYWKINCSAPIMITQIRSFAGTRLSLQTGYKFLCGTRFINGFPMIVSMWNCQT